MKHIRTLYKKLYSLKLSIVLVIASPTTPTKAVAFLIYLLVKNNMTDREQFGAKLLLNLKKILKCRFYQKMIFGRCYFGGFSIVLGLFLNKKGYTEEN